MKIDADIIVLGEITNQDLKETLNVVSTGKTIITTIHTPTIRERFALYFKEKEVEENKKILDKSLKKVKNDKKIVL